MVTYLELFHACLYRASRLPRKERRGLMDLGCDALVWHYWKEEERAARQRLELERAAEFDAALDTWHERVAEDVARRQAKGELT